MAYALIGKCCEGVGWPRCDFVIDTDADVDTLPKCNPGSSAVSVASGKVYIVNASGKWVEFGGGE